MPTQVLTVLYLDGIEASKGLIFPNHEKFTLVARNGFNTDDIKYAFQMLVPNKFRDVSRVQCFQLPVPFPIQEHPAQTRSAQINDNIYVIYPVTNDQAEVHQITVYYMVSLKKLDHLLCKSKCVKVGSKPDNVYVENWISRGFFDIKSSPYKYELKQSEGIYELFLFYE